VVAAAIGAAAGDTRSAGRSAGVMILGRRWRGRRRRSRLHLRGRRWRWRRRMTAGGKRASRGDAQHDQRQAAHSILRHGNSPHFIPFAARRGSVPRQALAILIPPPSHLARECKNCGRPAGLAVYPDCFSPQPSRLSRRLRVAGRSSVRPSPGTRGGESRSQFAPSRRNRHARYTSHRPCRARNRRRFGARVLRDT